jgi:hypothetical protein
MASYAHYLQNSGQSKNLSRFFLTLKKDKFWKNEYICNMSITLKFKNSSNMTFLHYIIFQAVSLQFHYVW